MTEKRQIGAGDAQGNGRMGGRDGCHSAMTSKPRVRTELDPMFYPDLEAFRAAVANGTVDVAKGCRNMNEYYLSLERQHV